MEENILCFTVILADDEPQILEGIRDSVEWETLGFRVIATALNGNELLEQTETLRPDLVIRTKRFWTDWKWRESCMRT